MAKVTYQHIDPAQLARRRIVLHNTGIRAITGEALDGVTVSGRCRLAFVNGADFDAYEIGFGGQVRTFARASDGLVLRVTNAWIRSLAYYYEPRPKLGGGHFAAMQAIFRKEGT